jgi:hypothetical protein
MLSLRLLPAKAAVSGCALMLGMFGTTVHS